MKKVSFNKDGVVINVFVNESGSLAVIKLGYRYIKVRSDVGTALDMMTEMLFRTSVNDEARGPMTYAAYSRSTEDTAVIEMEKIAA